MNNNSFLRKKVSGLSILFCLIMLSVQVNAQNFLEIPVKLEIEKGDLNDVVVKVKKEGKDAFTQSGASKMRFKLDFGKKYTLIFTKPGYITKTIEVNTTAPASRISNGFDPYKIGLKLFKQGEEKTVIYNQSVARIKYDENLDDFNYDTDYSKSILSAVKSTDDEDESGESTPSNKEVIATTPAPDTNSKIEPATGTSAADLKVNNTTAVVESDKKPENKVVNSNPASEDKPKSASPAAGVDNNLTASVSSDGDNNSSIIMNAGEESAVKNAFSQGEDKQKNNSSASGQEKISKKLNPGDGQDVQSKMINPVSGNENQSDPAMNFENERITREDIVEKNRVITKVTVIKGNKVTEYSRVNYSWGGLYYFKNSSMSISSNLFVQWTGINN